MTKLNWVPACGLALLAGCAGMGDETYFRPEHGWSLCRAPMPVEPVSRSGSEGWTEDQRTDIAAAIGLAIALRCIESDTVAQQAAGYRGITAVNSPGASRVNVTPQGRMLRFDIPADADYRTGEFLADLRNAITCELAPGEAADPGSCLPG